MLGTGEIVLIIVAILIIFGAKKIPELSESIGKAIKNLKKGFK